MGRVNFREKNSCLRTENWKGLKREVVKLISKYFTFINREKYISNNNNNKVKSKVSKDIPEPGHGGT
jgi:hypothetical protein